MKKSTVFKISQVTEQQATFIYLKKQSNHIIKIYLKLPSKSEGQHNSRFH